MDPGASHYQDPEARMTLREYLGSAQKFDEALEFGFPTMEERPRKSEEPRLDLSLDFDKPRTFLDDDDDRSSLHSDDDSMAEPESPRTPQTLDKATNEEHAAAVFTGQAPRVESAMSSREMTLRMTLTRPDLRANDEEIYGWRKGPVGRVTHARTGSKAPSVLVREVSAKDSIERQLAALDQEDMATGDNGVVKRFWKRVRRS